MGRHEKYTQSAKVYKHLCGTPDFSPFASTRFALLRNGTSQKPLKAAPHPQVYETCFWGNQ
jgi:hypothetical protein